MFVTPTTANASSDSEARDQKKARYWFNRLESLLPWLFVVFATPLVLFLVVVTPPFQSPDESNHFLRAYQIAHGGFVGTGCWVDAAIPDFIRIYDQRGFRSTAEEESAARKVRWAGRKVYVEFPNTAANAPIGYIPQAIGVLLGERFDLSVLRTFTLSRLLNGALALALCAWALVLCRRGRFVLFTVLLFPMSLSLLSSCSQDATIIGAAAVGFALVSRQVDERRSADTLTTIVLAFCFFVVVILRPPYIPLLLILLLPGLLPTFGRASSWPFAIGLTGALAILTVGWTVGYAFAQAASFSRHDPHGQLLYLLYRPDSLIMIFWNTLGRYFASTSAQFIGVLGWLDTPLPTPYYVLAGVALVISIYAELTSTKDWSPRAAAFIVVAVFAAFIGMYIAEYLILNPVGSNIITGVQGRYWIPLVMAAGIGLPRLARLGRQSRVAVSVVTLFPLLTTYYLPVTIIRRYYS